MVKKRNSYNTMILRVYDIFSLYEGKYLHANQIKTLLKQDHNLTISNIISYAFNLGLISRVGDGFNLRYTLVEKRKDEWIGLYAKYEEHCKLKKNGKR